MESAKEWCRLLNDCFAGKVNLIVTQKVSNVSRKTNDIAFVSRLLAAQKEPVGMAAVADNDVGQQTQPEPEHEQLSMTKVKIVCNSGTVNIRVGNGTDYGRITAVADGTVFEHVATASNGWHAVRVGSQVGWVSGKYSEIATE